MLSASAHVHPGWRPPCRTSSSLWAERPRVPNRRLPSAGRHRLGACRALEAPRSDLPHPHPSRSSPGPRSGGEASGPQLRGGRSDSAAAASRSCPPLSRWPPRCPGRALASGPCPQGVGAAVGTAGGGGGWGLGQLWGPEGAPPRAAPALYLGGSARAWGPRVQSLCAPSHLASVLGRPRSARPREDMAAPAPCELLRGGPVPLPPSLWATGSLGPSSARDTCPGQRRGRGHAGRTPMAADPRTGVRPAPALPAVDGREDIGGAKRATLVVTWRPSAGLALRAAAARPPGPPQDAALLGTTPHQPAGLWPADERGLKARPHARAARVGGARRSAGCPLTLGWGAPSASCP